MATEVVEYRVERNRFAVAALHQDFGHDDHVSLSVELAASLA